MAEADERLARRYLVTGRVQGVGFRYFVQRRAVELGLAGWVRNRPDGGVEVLAEGPVAALAKLRQALECGPSLARVEHVSENPAPAGGLEGFRIAG